MTHSRYARLKPFALNIIGSAIVSFGLFNVHSISNVTEGGVLGLTLLLEYWFDISPALSGFALNAICYVFGAIVLGKSFVLYSIVSGIGFSAFYSVFEFIGPLFPRIASHPFISAIVGALFVGIGVGLCVRGRGAPSGDDAMAMALSKKLSVNIRWIYLVSDLLVLLLSLSYIPLSKIAYSLLTVLLSGQIIVCIAQEEKT